MDYSSSLNSILSAHSVRAKCVNHQPANHFVTMTLELETGAKISSLKTILPEIQLGLKLTSKPILTMVPEDGTINITATTNKSETIFFGTLLDSVQLKTDELVLGVDASGQPLIVALDKLPHLLVSGTTGSGKSMFIHVLLANFIVPNRVDVECFVVDPKVVEFENYKDYKKSWLKVYNTFDEALTLLKMLTMVMEKRYEIFAKENVKSIAEYCEAVRPMKRIVLVIDEFADLMFSSSKKNNMEELICRLAAKARAAGIHIVLATQRPSVNVITGLIKANFPTRIAFKTSSSADSRVIMDLGGAEHLLGSGDALLSGYGSTPVQRFQSAYMYPHFVDFFIEEGVDG